jgi:hypothetical protein
MCTGVKSDEAEQEDKGAGDHRGEDKAFQRIGAMAAPIAPYPTLSEISKRVAGSYYTPTLFGPRTRFLVRLLGKLG